MGKSHSLDIRERVVAMVEAGHSCRSAARRFAIGDSTAIRVMQRRRKAGAVSASPPRASARPWQACGLSGLSDRSGRSHGTRTCNGAAAARAADHGRTLRPLGNADLHRQALLLRADRALDHQLPHEPCGLRHLSRDRFPKDQGSPAFSTGQNLRRAHKGFRFNL